MSHMKIIPLIAAGDDAVRESTRLDATTLKAQIDAIAHSIEARIDMVIRRVEALERALVEHERAIRGLRNREGVPPRT